MTRRITPAVLAAVVALTLGVGAKAVRYGHDAAPPQANVEARITDHLQLLGWALTGPKFTRNGALYDGLTFARQNCPHRLTIGLLGGSIESADLFRLDHGGDAAYWQDGDLLERPNGFKRQWFGFSDAIRGALGGRVDDRLPVLGIAPAPDVIKEASATHGTHEGCQFPAAHTWPALDAGRSGAAATKFKPPRGIVENTHGIIQ